MASNLVAPSRWRSPAFVNALDVVKTWLLIRRRSPPAALVARFLNAERLPFVTLPVVSRTKFAAFTTMSASVNANVDEAKYVPPVIVSVAGE